MYGLRTSGTILQILAVTLMVFGIAAGVLSMLTGGGSRYYSDPLPGFLTIVYSVIGGLLGILIGAAAQALADIAESNRESAAALQLLVMSRAKRTTSAAPPAPQPADPRPLYKRLEDRDK